MNEENLICNVLQYLQVDMAAIVGDMEVKFDFRSMNDMLQHCNMLTYTGLGGGYGGYGGYPGSGSSKI